jgi:hypothetical protein
MIESLIIACIYEETQKFTRFTSIPTRVRNGRYFNPLIFC